jgi:hypothetical protein
MEIAEGRLRIDPSGSDVPLHNLTPAEAMVLQKGFFQAANGEPLSKIFITGKTSRSNKTEADRLKEKYKNLRISDGGKTVDVTSHLFPGASPELPQTFEAAHIAVLREAPYVPPVEPDAPEGGDDIELTDEEVQRRAAQAATERTAFAKVVSEKK